MKRTLLLIFLFPLIAFSQSINIIPLPAEVKPMPGSFNFANGVSIKVADGDNETIAISSQLATALFACGVKILPQNEQGRTILLRLYRASNIYPGESYQLTVLADTILITATTHRGLSYGYQSVIQLFSSASNNQIPSVFIADTPEYSWRGMEIDVCRHFFSKEVIKQYIDLLAKLKMNVFHWHLTDDQGWRIEIKKYPKLTEVGAWRTEKDGSKYGGFYTQNDIKEIVAYTNERYVTIVPEIELPGHFSADIAAYPELSCEPSETKTVPNTWGIKPDIYCPSDFTFQFLRDVLDEVCVLFPGQYIHLGGDEAPKSAWKKSKLAQDLIKKEALKNEEELQHWFLKKMEDYLATKNKTVIGWGEIVKGGLSDSVIVMSWMDKYAGAKAAKEGNRVIMTPRFFCYFDYPSNAKDKKGAWYMTYLPAKKVYRFNPQAKTRGDLIMGGQANVWTEKIVTEAQLQHQIMPRLAAMAEALWTAPELKDYKNFSERLSKAKTLSLEH